MRVSGVGDQRRAPAPNNRAAAGLAGLRDRARPGKTAKYGADLRLRVLRQLELPPPKGMASWDGASLARSVGRLGRCGLAPAWRQYQHDVQDGRCPHNGLTRTGCPGGEKLTTELPWRPARPLFWANPLFYLERARGFEPPTPTLARAGVRGNWLISLYPLVAPGSRS